MSYRNFNHPAFRELTFGTGGVGKTTFFAERLKKQRARVIFIYDHKHEFCGKLGVAPVFTLTQLAAATEKGGTICFDPCELFPGRKAAGFTFFADYVYQISGELRGRKILVCDELQKMADADADIYEFGLCLDDGRCLELDFMGITHGANRVHTLIRAQATECYTFRQSDENSVKILAKDYGFNPEEVRALRPGQWLWRNLNSGATARGGNAFEIKSPRKGSARVIAPGPAVEKRGGEPGDKRADSAGASGENLPEVRSTQSA